MRKAYCDMCGAELRSDNRRGWFTVTVAQRWGNKERTLDFCASCHDKFWAWLNHLCKEADK